MKHKILTYLEKLGLSSREAELYWLLLTHGPMTVKELAVRAKINRTATYPQIDALLHKGIISEVQKGSRKQLIANDPEQLEVLIKRQEIAVQEVQSQFPQMLQAIYGSLPHDTEDKKVEVKYYKGVSGVKTLFEEALKSTELRTYVNIQDVHESIDNTELFVSAMQNNKKIVVYEIISESNKSQVIIEQFLGRLHQSEQKRYVYKYLPRGMKLSAADTLIYDGKVAIINYGDTDNITGVVLKNNDYYTNSKELFDFIWNVLPEKKLQ